MNIHPMIVHFPIALLFIWSVLEIFHIQRWIKSVDWKSTKAVLLTIGTIGAFFAKETGETARDQITTIMPTLSWHETFAKVSFALYFLFLVEVALTIVISQSKTRKMHFPAWFMKIMHIYQGSISFAPIRIPLVVMALMALTITGVLGGVLVYGTSADPIAPLVLRFLGIR